MAIVLSGSTNDITVNGVSVATDTEVSSAITDAVQTGLVALQTIATGTATFTATTNNINLTGIGIGIEIGDVIQISGSTNNNSEFTVEVITDANNIIVNQAHANKSLTYPTGQRTKTLATETSSVTIKLLAKYYNAPHTLGRDWVNVTISRAINTQYSNLTNRALEVNLYSSQNAGTYSRLAINGILTISTGGTSASHVASQISGLVPSNGKYTQTQDAGATVQAWFELR